MADRSHGPRIDPIPVAARPLQGLRAGVVSRSLAGGIDYALVAATVAGTYFALVVLRFLIDPRENFPLDHLLPGRDAQFDQGHTINVEAHVQPVHSLYLASRRDRGGQAAPANGHDLRRRLGGLRRAVTQLPIDSAPRDYHGQGHYPSVSLPEAHAPPRLSTVPRVPRQPSRAATEWTAR